MSCTDGREPISVDQPPGGSGQTYPFHLPSDDIFRLFADAYIAYEASMGEFALPLKLAWAYGFGETVVSPIGGWPTPTHNYDVVIHDSEGNVFFDSTTADSFETRDWGDRLRIVEWMNDNVVCRLVYHLCWDEDEAEYEQDYDLYIVPDTAVFNADVVNVVAKRLRKIVVETEDGDVEIVNRGVVFKEGYNMSMSAEELETDDGGEQVSELSLSAIAGAGMGRNPGCVDDEPAICTVNRQEPDEGGNLILDVGGCYRLEPEFVQTNVDPIEYTVTGNTLVLINDCIPCCQCSQFEAVYAAIVRLHETYKDLGRRAGCVRDRYQDNRTRWITAGRNRIYNPLRLAVMPGSDCRLEIAGAWCNNTPLCVEDLELRFTINAGPRTPLAVCGRAFRSGNISDTSREAGCVSDSTLERYAMIETPPDTFSGMFDKVAIAGMAYVRFQVTFPGCVDTDDIEVTLGAYINDLPVTYNVGWPDNNDQANVEPITVNSLIFNLDPCSDSSA